MWFLAMSPYNSAPAHVPRNLGGTRRSGRLTDCFSPCAMVTFAQQADARQSNVEGSTSGIDTWRLHATDPTLINTDEWRAGEFDANNLVLTGSSWQYIQIQVPDFMVEAIWPDWPEGDVVPSVSNVGATTYTTPYLELMQAAISHFGLTAQRQEKKECLVTGSGCNVSRANRYRGTSQRPWPR